ncbi:MAG: SAM-dependent methyltransferase [Micrococcales bacterium]|nr:MAG: SAM-dependent methyltransferase [Micrococcales bacterium]
MARQGHDLHGEARLVDAMAGRNAHILDAGCGPGRVGGQLHRLGHRVVGVDLDRALIDAAQADHPGPTWLVADLAELDLTEHGIDQPFEVIVVAGNVMTFLAPTTRRPVLQRLRAHLSADGRVAVGFGAGRGYEFDQFFADLEATGLRTDARYSTWDLRPFGNGSDYLVTVLSATAEG